MEKSDKKFNNNFKIKNADKIKEKVICPICKGSYTYFNKSTHNKTKRHQDFCKESKKEE